MEITIKREIVDGENSKFCVNKTKDMTWLEVIGVLEIIKEDIIKSTKIGE